MSEELKSRKMSIEQFEPKTKIVVLGSTFSATLDKKQYFPKHVSLQCHVEDSKLIDQLSVIPVGTVICAKVHTDFSDMKNYLDDFTAAN
jgi:hypothetical protein